MENPVRATLEQLVEERQREHLARYLFSRPLVADEFMARQRAVAADMNEPEFRREMAEQLVAWLDTRMKQLKSASERAYREHKHRRRRILGR